MNLCAMNLVISRFTTVPCTLVESHRDRFQLICSHGTLQALRLLLQHHTFGFLHSDLLLCLVLGHLLLSLKCVQNIPLSIGGPFEHTQN